MITFKLSLFINLTLPRKSMVTLVNFQPRYLSWFSRVDSEKWSFAVCCHLNAISIFLFWSIEIIFGKIEGPIQFLSSILFRQSCENTGNLHLACSVQVPRSSLKIEVTLKIKKLFKLNTWPPGGHLDPKAANNTAGKLLTYKFYTTLILLYDWSNGKRVPKGTTELPRVDREPN